MAINLTVPLAWKKAVGDELKLLQSLQGNILKGHGRNFTSNIFFKVDSTKQVEARRKLREIGNFLVTSAHQQLLGTEHFKATGEGAGAFVHLALSFKGYQALGLVAGAPADPDFQGGMKAPASLNALLDPPVNTWEAPFQQDIHGVLVAAHNTLSETAALTSMLRELIEEGGGSVVHVQRGAALHNKAAEGIENFGYVDGRSQPLLLQEDIETENVKGGSSRWDPAFPLSAALVDDPGVTDGFSFGSFFIFRKLEQDVRAFKLREQEVADLLALQGEARELAGALIVGRFEDGTPVTLSDEARGGAVVNNFNYVGDPGKRCPFHAHIRKVNPRGTGGAEAEPAERAHLMPRRGIPYEDVKRLVHPDELPEVESLNDFKLKVAPMLPTGGVGLLFMAYNQRIGQQFKFTQQTWANNKSFPVQPPGTHGIDPVIGQGANNVGDQKLAKQWDNLAAGTNATASFSGFVKMRGGEYFFSPSLTFLRNL